MAGLFGTSGIRRRIAEFPPDFAFKLGVAAATVFTGKVAVGRDTRASGPIIQAELEKGLMAGGADVLSTGIAPTPTVCCGTGSAQLAAVVTASHNPPEYNGFKFFDSSGAIRPEMESQIEAAMGDGNEKHGGIEKADFSDTHIDHILSHQGEAEGVKVLLDCAGGAGSMVTPRLLEALGCVATIINDRRDGIFPHGLEPTEGNLVKTMGIVAKADVDIAFAHDGDADRTCAIAGDGSMVEWDTFLTLLAVGNKKVVTTVDASMRIEEFCEKVYRVPVGDVAVCRGIMEEDAGFGGEPSGTFIFPDIHIFPDGVATVAKAVSIFASGDFERLVKEIPTYPMQRVKVPCAGDKKEAVMEGVRQAVAKENHTSVDGVRVDRDWGWVLIRPSGTEDYMRITAEAKDPQRLDQLVALAKGWLKEAGA